MPPTRDNMVDLTIAECRELLITHRPRLGRLAFVDAGLGSGRTPVWSQSQQSAESRRGNHRLKNAMFLAAFAAD